MTNRIEQIVKIICDAALKAQNDGQSIPLKKVCEQIDALYQSPNNEPGWAGARHHHELDETENQQSVGPDERQKVLKEMLDLVDECLMPLINKATMSVGLKDRWNQGIDQLKQGK